MLAIKNKTGVELMCHSAETPMPKGMGFLGTK